MVAWPASARLRATLPLAHVVEPDADDAWTAGMTPHGIPREPVEKRVTRHRIILPCSASHAGASAIAAIVANVATTPR